MRNVLKQNIQYLRNLAEVQNSDLWAKELGVQIPVMPSFFFFFFLLFRNQGIAENEGNEVRSLKVEMEKPHI